ncbi:glycerophosphodiester phosphodiesterase [Aquimarina algicola]|uniref:Glycerophosphodiester phosphodiesterase n=1 Tax=Aquimarina algicola TaxID=2589995 RepID=A0A504J9H4_9FLAO|nr:glycerophosphodiester phosphodiesterase family protein [Aquimarina algicola]TPN87274.1 glycerophosphodiester phosphodiesterase [Aquimarina algicola]
METFGHRGAAGLVAENTVESVEEALRHHVDGIEIDVHLCKTGDLVAIHDDTLDRTTNGKGNVSDYTLHELRQFKTQEGYVIPNLKEILNVINAQCKLNIELKGKNTAMPTIRLLNEYIKNTDWDYEHFIISSFDHSQLFQIKEANSRFKLGVLTEENVKSVLPIAHRLKAYSIHPPVSSLVRDEVERAKKLGYRIYVWTVNDKFIIDQSKSWNIDGIITDFPNFV